MKRNPIGVIDSGVGGASILHQVIKDLPNEQFIYYVDNLNSPYGNKSRKTIQMIIDKNVDYLVKKHHIKMLIVACNTASTVCAEELRERLNIPVVCVEPPIKPAVDYGYKNILVLATSRTVKSNVTIKKFEKLLKKWNKNHSEHAVHIKKLAIKNLASEIDRNIKNLNKLEHYLYQRLCKYHYCDAVVLGCTHYNFIKEELHKVLPFSEIISCEDAISKRTAVLLNRYEIAEKRLSKNRVKVVLSKNDEYLKSFIENYLCL